MATLFLSDAFTNTGGTALASHTATTLGGQWVEHGSYTTGDAVISNANRMRWNTGTTSSYYNPATPASADYSVRGVIRVMSVAGELGIAARVNTAANTMYFVRLTTTNWQLFRMAGGSAGQLGSNVAVTPTIGTDYTVTLTVSGTGATVTLVVNVDGVDIISTTDVAGTRIVATGVAGLRGATGSDSGGFHLDSLIAGVDLDVGGGGSGALLAGHRNRLVV